MQKSEASRDAHAVARRGIEALLAAHADVAETDLERGDGYVRIALRPRVANACPLDLVLFDDGAVDLRLAEEEHEGVRDIPPARLATLIGAVLAGKVKTIRETTLATGQLRSVEVVVRPDRGEAWRRRREVEPISRLVAPEAAEREAHHYVAYRREDAPRP